ncbi:hypothetical protein J422_01238 [Methanocaldococcus villosus KIN24-T80]|uniref:AAA domain-containing protein n=1 Tax=Methanocaldococcus villosus KIN24-T80 TaxID=1069083 RepID=N6V307_9EURY|nr:MinD/ParA family protein [Methanocaldococcus villosus]ENN96623.1 hypothetical protein J422_01238 [Methanocaldococcus villosus KIN24-T80]
MKVGFYNIQGGTGKTTVAANFAYIVSQSTKTIFIDCDIYGGTSSIIFNLEDKEHNLASYLAGESVLEDIIYTYDDLSVIPSDMSSKVFAYKIDVSRLDHLLDTIEDEYDIIVYDFPPNITEDNPLLTYVGESELINKVIIVGEDSLPSIVNSLKTMELVKDLNIPTIGIIVNKYRGIVDLEDIIDDVIGVLPYDQKVERQWVESLPIAKLKTKFSKELQLLSKDIAKIYLEKDLASLRALKLAKTIYGLHEDEEEKEEEFSFNLNEKFKLE